MFFRVLMSHDHMTHSDNTTKVSSTVTSWKDGCYGNMVAKPNSSSESHMPQSS